MNKLVLRTITVGSVVCAVALPVAWAWTPGAPMGMTGGPGGNGQSCTVCHGFNPGPGGVELLGAPRRYRAGQVYDLTLRVFDVEQDGAGCEISAEGAGGHVGFIGTNGSAYLTFADGDLDYVTHTELGRSKSVSRWPGNGGSFVYNPSWEAPLSDQGPIRFFAAGNAITTTGSFMDARYYVSALVSYPAVTADVDGDTDVDLGDYAEVQRCLGMEVGGTSDCAHADVNADGVVSVDDLAGFAAALTGPTTTLPAAYFLADAARGGRLYDKWWIETGTAEPMGDHPLYPPVGQRAGSTTYRCKECHGWDYKGRDGAYGGGSHFTDINGVFGSALGAGQVFDLLKADPVVISNGHDMDAFGLTDADIWDVVKFVNESLVDTDAYISGGAFIGDGPAGGLQFNFTCSPCHGFDGTNINFGTTMDPVYIGTVASTNPWEFLHKVRAGQPGTPMLGFEHLFWTAQVAADVSNYSQTLPTE